MNKMRLPRRYIIKKNQREIVELKYTVNEMKNAIEYINNILNEADESICETEDRT